MAQRDIGRLTGIPSTYQVPSPAGGVKLATFVPWTLMKRGIRRAVINPASECSTGGEPLHPAKCPPESSADPAMLRSLGLAHYWQMLLDKGRFASISDIAKAEGIDMAQASRIAKLALLKPELIEHILQEAQSSGVVSSRCSVTVIPLDWTEQSNSNK